eukprot:7259750-Pyramimonas_sp.AAC.1
MLVLCHVNHTPMHVGPVVVDALHQVELLATDAPQVFNHGGGVARRRGTVGLKNSNLARGARHRIQATHLPKASAARRKVLHPAVGVRASEVDDCLDILLLGVALQRVRVLLDFLCHRECIFGRVAVQVRVCQELVDSLVCACLGRCSHPQLQAPLELRLLHLFPRRPERIPLATFSPSLRRQLAEAHALLQQFRPHCSF